MRTMLVLTVCLLLSSAVVGNAPSGTATPKKYTVNLDLPSEKRWQEVVLDNKNLVKDVHEVLK